MSAQLCLVLSQIMQTDGWTDGQADTFLVASPCWHSMQCGTNAKWRLIN